MLTADTWTRFLDDAGPVLAGPSEQRSSPAVGDRVVSDVDLPLLRGYDGDLRVVLSGGAAQVAGPGTFCVRNDLELSALDTTLSDLDDPAGNARRVVAAVDAAVSAGALLEDTLVHVRVAGGPTPSWLAAADVVAAAEMVLCLPLDAGDPERWIDAALDRETEVSLVGGTVEQAVAALRTAARLWGDEADLAAARRWVRCWVTDDVDSALAYLAGLA